MKLFIGVDIGTSLIKAGIYNLKGENMDSASCKVPVISPQEGYAEQDMDVLWTGVASCLASLTSRNKERLKDVAAISCAGQGDGLWAVDVQGQPAGNAILWFDNRASENVERWNQRGISEEFFIKSGTTLWPGCTAAILDWLKEHDTAYYRRIDLLFYCKDWINFKLTDRKATDISDGTIPFMDITTSEISRDQIALLGLDPDIFEKTARVLNSYDVIGEVTSFASEQTGLPEGLPVITGMIDVSANAIGAGVIHTGQTFAIIGTTLLNAVLLDRPFIEPANIGATVTSPLPHQWLRALGSLGGTPNLDWLLREVFGRRDYENIKQLYTEIEETVRAVPPGANKVLYLPFIHGERSPFVDPYATASFLGVREKTTKADLLRAVYEGVALAARHNLSSVRTDIREIVITGGGSSDAVWCQIFADVTGAQIRVPARRELGTLGAAIIAAKGIGAIQQFSFENFDTSTDRLYSPDQETHDFYNGLYELYVSAIALMEPYWKQRNELYK